MQMNVIAPPHPVNPMKDIETCKTLVRFSTRRHEQEPEHAPSSAAASSSSPAPTYNKVAVHCFLCICLRHRLELIDDAETESDTAMISALNAIHDVLMDVFSLFERDGISPASLQLVKDMHSALNECCHEVRALSL